MPYPRKASGSTSACAFQGELGAFSSIAARRFLGPNVALRPCATFRQVFEHLKDGLASHAAIPIENTLYGSVPENFDNLLNYDFAITAETAVRVEHHLIGGPAVRFRNVRRVYSHPVALGQCRKFFDQHPKIEAVSFYDTAGSVKMLLESQQSDAAALASDEAAKVYGGTILRKNLEDDRRNYTRFFLLSKQGASRPKTVDAPWKTSLFFSTANRPGALFRALACFALRDISLTRIESRPLRSKPWEYLFYVDTLAHCDDITLQKAVENLHELSGFVKVLGTYQAV